jgi:transcriptional regulator of aromatic amino acid metabolism
MVESRPQGPDEMSVALGALAASAEQTAIEQRQVAASARVLRRQREEGRSWSSILAQGEHPSLVHLLSASLRRLTETSGRFRAAVAIALAREGLSTRQIASRLGVTHQRVSAMLSRPKPDATK